MKKQTKIWLGTATFLVIVGSALFALAMSEYEWDFAKLSTENYETNTYALSGEFTNLSMMLETAEVVFTKSDDGKCRVECYEDAKAKHSVVVQGDTLSVAVTNDKSWYDYIGIHFESPKITVHLPKTEYTSLSIDGSTGNVEIPSAFEFGDMDISLSTGGVAVSASVAETVKIQTDTGHVRVENCSIGALDLSVSTGLVTVSNVRCERDISIDVTTGKTKLTDVECKNLISDGDTGDIRLTRVVAAEAFQVVRDTGDVKWDASDAGEIFVETDTGDVTGSLLTDKVFITDTDTGRVSVPNTVTGGRCEISTDTGDIKITVIGGEGAKNGI